MDTEKSFEELAKGPKGTIYHHEKKEGYDFIILKGPASLCAYFVIDKDHPLANHNKELLPISCHGGFTYSGTGVQGMNVKNKWIYGWDYAHAGDFSFYDLDYPGEWRNNDKKWTVKQIIADAWEAQIDFENLLRLAEEIWNKKEK